MSNDEGMPNEDAREAAGGRSYSRKEFMSSGFVIDSLIRHSVIRHSSLRS